MDFEQSNLVKKDDSKYSSLLKNSPLLQNNLGSFLPWIVVSYLVLQCIFLALPHSKIFSTCTTPTEMPEWFVGITFGCGFTFLANALLQAYAIIQSNPADSMDSVTVMHWTVLTIHFLSGSSQLFYVFADRRICVDAFGVHSIATQWVEWFFTLPLIALLTSAVMERKTVGIHSYLFVFNFALIIILAMLLIIDPVRGKVYASLAALQLFVAPALASDIGHNEEVSKAMFENLDWLRTKQDIEQYIFLRQGCWSKKFISSFLFLTAIFPLVYVLSAFGFINNYLSCGLFALTSLLEKLIFTSILSQSFIALQEDMLKLFAAASKAQETRRTLLRYVFHELRTPLHSITAGLPSVYDRLPYICSDITPGDEQMLDMLQKSTEGLVDVVNQVLTLQSVQEGEVSMKMSIFRFSEWINLMIQRAMPTLATKQMQLCLVDPTANHNQNFTAMKKRLFPTGPSASSKFRSKSAKLPRNTKEERVSTPVFPDPKVNIPDIIEGDVSHLSSMMQALCTSLTGIVSNGSKIEIVLSTTAPEDLFSRCVHDTNMLARSIVFSSPNAKSLVTISPNGSKKFNSLASSSLSLSHALVTIIWKVMESFAIVLYHLYHFLHGVFAVSDKVQPDRPFSLSTITGEEEYENIYCSFRSKDFAGLSTESIQALYEPFQYLRHAETREASSASHTSIGKEQQPQKDMFQQQTGHEDTGLGFALAREIVHLMPGCFLVFLAGNQVKNLPAEICLCIRTRRISSSSGPVAVVSNLASLIDASLSCKFASSSTYTGAKSPTSSMPENDVSSVMVHRRLMRHLNPFTLSSPRMVNPGELGSKCNSLVNTPAAAGNGANTKRVFFAPSPTNSAVVGKDNTKFSNDIVSPTTHQEDTVRDAPSQSLNSDNYPREHSQPQETRHHLEFSEFLRPGFSHTDVYRRNEDLKDSKSKGSDDDNNASTDADVEIVYPWSGSLSAKMFSHVIVNKDKVETVEDSQKMFDCHKNKDEQVVDAEDLTGANSNDTAHLFASLANCNSLKPLVNADGEVKEVKKMNCLPAVSLTLSLPAVAPFEAASLSKDAKPILHCLVVDDVSSNSKMLAHNLRRRGHRVTICSDGEEAVHTVSRFGRDYFDVIFMDNIMPIMSGLEATHYLRTVLGYDRFIFGVTSGNLVTEDIEEEFLVAGADMVLAKPVKQSEIDAILQCLCTDYTSSNAAVAVEERNGNQNIEPPRRMAFHQSNVKWEFVKIVPRVLDKDGINPSSESTLPLDNQEELWLRPVVNMQFFSEDIIS